MEAECLFWRILLCVDSAGRFYGSAIDVGLRCNPRRFRDGGTDAASVAAQLSELEREGLIGFYRVEGDLYLQVEDYWEPSRGRVEKFPSPGRPQPGDDAGTDYPQPGAAVSPNPFPETETPRQKQRQETETDARARELSLAPAEQPASPREDLRRALVSFPQLAGDRQLAPMVVAWLSARGERGDVTRPPTASQLKASFALITEFPREVSARVLEAAISGGAKGAWLSLKRDMFENVIRERQLGGGKVMLTPQEQERERSQKAYREYVAKIEAEEAAQS
jgi:hypothetical protein